MGGRPRCVTYNFHEIAEKQWSAIIANPNHCAAKVLKQLGMADYCSSKGIWTKVVGHIAHTI